MKITAIKTNIMSVPLKHPFRIALGVIDSATSVIIEIETDEGLIGYGEASPGPFITGENMEGTIAGIKRMARELIGVDPTDIEKVHGIMNKSLAKAGTPKAGIDIACYDLLGKKAGLPLYKLLGGLDNRIVTDITISIDEPSVMGEKAREYVNAGFDTIKTKVGIDAESDIDRVKAIRNAVGDKVKIRLDANQGWNKKEALKIIDRLKEYDIELIEQPLPYWDVDGLKELTALSPIPIMADESCIDSKDALRLIRERAVDYINIKLMKCGGIWEARKIVDIAEAAGVECMLGCMTEESGIAINGAASLGCALANITRADLDATFSLKNLPFTGGFSVEKAKNIVLSDKPGLGIDNLKREMFSE